MSWLSMDVKCMPEFLTLREEATSLYRDVRKQAPGLGGLSCWESLIEVGTLRASPKLSAHQNTQTRTHKQHLKSEKICEILQAMEVTVTTYPCGCKETTPYSGFREDPIQQQDGCPLAGVNTTPEKAKGRLR